MATTIKTQVLLPRADLSDWASSTRVFKDGELGIAKFDEAGKSKFKLFAGIEGQTFEQGVRWLSSDIDLSEVSATIAENISSDIVDEISAAITEDISATIADAISGEISEAVATDISDDVVSSVVEQVSVDFTDTDTVTFGRIEDTNTISAQVVLSSITNAHIAPETIVPDNLSSEGWVFDCNE